VLRLGGQPLTLTSTQHLKNATPHYTAFGGRKMPLTLSTSNLNSILGEVRAEGCSIKCATLVSEHEGC